MARMTAMGGRRRLVDLWATAPSAVTWQEPLGQDSFPPPSSSSWSRETIYLSLFVCFLVFFFVCLCVCRFLCRNKKDDDEHDRSRFVVGPWSNDAAAQGVSAPLPPPLQEQAEQQPPESGDGHAPQINSREGDAPPRQRRRRRRRRQQAPVEAELPAADEEMVLRDVQLTLTQAEVDWILADLLVPAADMDMEPAPDMDMAPAADEEIAPAPEPGPTLKCTYNRADGWDEGTCTVCLSELVDGEMVRVLTACMHCFHASCIETWLRNERNTCPICRALVQVRRRRRRSTQTSA